MILNFFKVIKFFLYFTLYSSSTVALGFVPFQVNEVTSDLQDLGNSRS